MLIIRGDSFDLDGTARVVGNDCNHTVAGGFWGHQKIICQIPEGQGVGSIAVETTQGTTMGLEFAYGAPRILNLEGAPFSTAGGVLTIFGSSMGFTGTVAVWDRDCAVLTYTHTKITCNYSAGQGTERSVVVTSGGVDSESSFLDYEAPQIDSLSPLSAPTVGNSALTLTGRSFGSEGSIEVFIGPNPCSVTFQSHAEVVCTIPVGSGAQEVRTIVSGQSSSFVDWTYSPPNVSSVTPVLVSTGGEVELTIGGTSFGTAGTVLIGGSPCSITSHSHTQIKCMVGAGVGKDLSVQVDIDSLPSNTDVTVSYREPVIGSINPSAADTSGNILLTIFGSDFGPGGADIGYVSIAGTICPLLYDVYSFSQIVCILPEGSGDTNSVQVTVAGQVSNATNFAYNGPVLTSINPQNGPTDANSGSGGYEVVIVGSSLGVEGTITIGGAVCSVLNANDHTHNQITCQLPQGSRTTNVVSVNINGQTNSTLNYAYARPSISSIAPLNGPTEGGVSVILSGSSFSTSGLVAIGGSTCSPTGGGHSHKRIECLLPEGTGPSNSVTVTNIPVLRIYSCTNVTWTH